jgi:hypothetical protein
MKSPIPLLLGAGALFMLMRGKQNGPVNNLFIVRSKDEISAMDNDEALKDRFKEVVLVYSTVEGVSPERVAELTEPIARDNPRQIFIVPGIPIKELAANPPPGQEMKNVILVTIGEISGHHKGHYMFQDVSADMVQHRIPAAYNFAVKNAEQGHAAASVSGPPISAFIESSAYTFPHS